MKSLRDYINIVEGKTLLENPWEGKDPAKAAAWAALSPEDQKALGNADPTDQFILARMPNKGQPAGQSATPAPTPAAAPGANVPNPGQPAAPANNQFSYDANGEMIPSDSADAQADAAAAQQAQPATQASVRAVDNKIAADQAASRDAMPFGKAFADAKAKGEKEFTWKGKKYAVAMAKPAAKPAAPAQAATPAPQPGMWDRFKNWATGGGKAGTPAGGTAPTGDIGTQMVAPESVDSKSDNMVNELDAIRRIAGLK